MIVPSRRAIVLLPVRPFLQSTTTRFDVLGSTQTARFASALSMLPSR